MSIIALLQEFDGKEIGEKARQPITGKLTPGLSKAELARLQELVPCVIPPVTQEVLTLCKGIKPLSLDLDFSGLSLIDGFEMSDVFPHALPIAADGAGNFWVADLHKNSKDWGPIFYACHDPAVIVWQAKDFEEFVQQLISLAFSEDGSAIELIKEQYAFQIWQDNPNVIPIEKAVQAGDPDLSNFAKGLDKDFQFIDLRRPRIGDGFSWGRFGPDTEIRRHGEQRLFAYRKAPRKPGFFSKLFGR